jgi:heme-degrading monooxygenase HmoA
MVTVGMYYDVIAGKEGAFEERFGEVLAALERQPGHVRTKLYHQVKSHNTYAILSEWKSREEFTTFLKSDLFREVTDWGKASILAGRPRHEIYSSAEGSV